MWKDISVTCFRGVGRGPVFSTSSKTLTLLHNYRVLSIYSALVCFSTKFHSNYRRVCGHRRSCALSTCSCCNNRDVWIHVYINTHIPPLLANRQGPIPLFSKVELKAAEVSPFSKTDSPFFKVPISSMFLSPLLYHLAPPISHDSPGDFSFLLCKCSWRERAFALSCCSFPTTSSPLRHRAALH